MQQKPRCGGWQIHVPHVNKLARSRILLLYGNNLLRWVNLSTWVVVSHLLVTYRMRCLRSTGIHEFEASATSAWRWLIDQRSSIRIGFKTGADMHVWNMAVESTCLKNFGAWIRCLGSTGRIWWEDFPGSLKVLHVVLSPRIQSSMWALNMNKVIWLRRLPLCTLSFETNNSWMVGQAGLSVTSGLFPCRSS